MVDNNDDDVVAPSVPSIIIDLHLEYFKLKKSLKNSASIVADDIIIFSDLRFYIK